MSGSKYLYPAPLPSEIAEAKIEVAAKTEGLFEGVDIREVELAKKFGGSYEKRSGLFGLGFLSQNVFVFPSVEQAAAFKRALEASNEFRTPAEEILEAPFDIFKKAAKTAGEGAGNLLKGLGLDLKVVTTLLLVIGGIFLTITLTKK